jgi:hypothetical protein
MGRWATSRRRGGGPEFSSGLTLPPAPQLDTDGSNLIQTATGADDSLGTIRLYESVTQFGLFTLAGTNAWQAVFDWATLSPTVQKWYRATEVGNGIAYAGESPPSAAVYFDP